MKKNLIEKEKYYLEKQKKLRYSLYEHQNKFKASIFGAIGGVVLLTGAVSLSEENMAGLPLIAVGLLNVVTALEIKYGKIRNKFYDNKVMQIENKLYKEKQKNKSKNSEVKETIKE